jgi:hypothetical protein
VCAAALKDARDGEQAARRASQLGKSFDEGNNTSQVEILQPLLSEAF